MKLTERQLQAQQILAGPATHQMLFGGSRSGKTFLLTRNVVMRAVKAPRSRHAILRFRFNAVKASIVMDTFPKVMQLAFPNVDYEISKTDWYARMSGDSEIWFGGLDDKDRTEKILGSEYATLYLNECSQIPFASRNVAMTRLAQKVDQVIDGVKQPLKLRAYYDCNPPNKAHWAYRLFVEKADPDSRVALPNPQDYVSFQINPQDNAQNVAAEYLDSLRSMGPRLQRRFLLGEWADANPNALFQEQDIDKWRVVDGRLPDMVRVIVGVDPSGADDQDNADNDEIGIVAVGLGTDGNAYVLQDNTVKAGPATWGKVATDTFDNTDGDLIVGETNFGGAMVKYVVQTAKPRVPFKMVTASRGKVQRAEPFSALYEQGKVRHVGFLTKLEDEITAFSTAGYVGAKSPNRADALFWALSEIFSGVVRGPVAARKPVERAATSWMG